MKIYPKIRRLQTYYDNEYDAQNRIVKISKRVWFSYDNKEQFWVTTYIEYVYNDMGNIVKENEYNRMKPLGVIYMAEYYGNICTCRKCNGIVHTIRRGDTLYLLSRHYSNHQ